MSSLIVGRDRPLAALFEAVDAVCHRRQRGFFLVAGEAGIGKTALLTATVGQASAKGALAVGGTCWDGDGVPGYWPWIQVVRGLERGAGDRWPALRQVAGDGLGRLLGEVPGRLTTADASSADEADFQVFDAVATVLTAAAGSRPVLVVLDDLQWADPASVRMLDFVVRHTALEALLVVAAYRDSEVGAAGHPLRSLLARAATSATELPLAGLDEPSVGAVIRSTAGRHADPETVREIRRRTGGNPFYVQQMASLWSATGSMGGVPPGLRDTIERRLALLPTACTALLSTAALLGTEFDLPVAAVAAGVDADSADCALDAAITARLVVPSEAGSCRFVHDLVRETLRQSLSEAAARQRHAAIVRVADGSARLAGRVLPAQLAYHAYLAVPEVAAEVAAAVLVAAGRDASRRTAAEEACGHFRRALELLTAHELPGRAEAAIQLGVHQQRIGDLDGARRTFADVVSQGRESGDAESFARGALGLQSLGHMFRDESGAGFDLLDQARSRLSATPAHAGGSPLLAMIMAAASQARSHAMGDDRDAGERLSADAVVMARRCEDAEALGFCLLARHDAIWRPGTAGERLAVAEEMAALAGRTADRELELQACLLRMVALLEAGDPRGLGVHEEFVALAERTRWPRFRYLAVSRQATIAILQGRFADARRHADDALELGRQIGEVDAGGVRHDQICEIARLEGRRDELDQLIAADQARGDPLGIVVAALSAVDSGDAGSALARAADVEDLARRWPRWASSMFLAYRAQLAAISGDRQRLAAVGAELTPLAEQWAVLGGAVVIRGPMAHWLALTDAAAGRWDEAIARFATAERMADRLQARPWSALARLGRAEAMLGRGSTAEAGTAAVLLDAVAAEAAELGMTPAATRAANLRRTAAIPTGGAPGAAVPHAARPASAAPARSVFRFDGEVWTLSFDGQTALLPDAKGLHDLHALLARPDTDIPVTELLEPAGGAVAAAAARLGADVVVDQRAKAEYRARLTALEEEIETALARREDQRAARLESERDALITELRRAFGLAGRPRLLGAAAERARKTVTARIRDTLRRLDARHPPLARYLRRTVSTGMYCCYRPARSITWEL